MLEYGFDWVDERSLPANVFVIDEMLAYLMDIELHADNSLMF